MTGETEQLTIYDLPEGRRRRDEGMAQVEANAGEVWNTFADMALRSVTSHLAVFTADDVHAELERVGAPEPHHPNAMGPALRRGQRAGLCHPLQQWRPSKRPQTHGRQLRMWASDREGEI